MTRILKPSLLILAAAVALMAQKAPTVAPAARTNVTAGSTAPKAAPADSQYVIGKDDILGISVWREPELSRAVAVRPDGRISLALVGEVMAAGLTPMQLQAKLTEMFDAYMTAPEVSVVVQDPRSQRFSIIGEVMRPGTYPLSKPMTVLDALALAGGFRDFAKTNKMFILRMNADGSRQRIPVRYSKVISERSSNQNPELQAHDTLVIP
jgi:polysaccharide export outer membrane protein